MIYKIWYDLCRLPGCIKGMYLFCIVLLLLALIAYQFDPSFYR